MCHNLLQEEETGSIQPCVGQHRHRLEVKSSILGFVFVICPVGAVIIWLLITAIL